MRTELRELMRLALPLALAQAGQAFMGLVDTAVLGWYSPAAQAGTGLGNSLSFTVVYLGMGVMLALDPLVSQAIGAGDVVRAKTHYWQGVWLALLTSVGVMALVALIPMALVPAGVGAEVASVASDYIWYRLPGIPGVLLFVGARSYLQGTDRVAVIFWAMVFANGVNFLLDLGLVFGAGPIPPLGAIGAAIATALSSWVQFAILIPSFGADPEGTKRRFDRREVLNALRLGGPIGLQFIVESGIFALAGLFAARINETAAAAHQIALTWGSVTFCVAFGLGSAAATRVGWALGATNPEAARRSGAASLLLVTGFMSISALGFLVAATPIIAAMSPDPAVRAVTHALFFVLAVFQVADGLQAVGSGLLRGASDTQASFWYNLVGHWFIGLPIAALLGVFGPLGVVGLWWGLCAGLTFVAVGLVLRFRTIMKRLARLPPA
jgi:MATE family multidrug resistance protein